MVCRILFFLNVLFFGVMINGNVIAQDLNHIVGSGFNIVVGPGAINLPEANQVTLGIQSEFDVNYRWQMVNVHQTDNFYLRRHVFGWSSWFKIWHSGNLNRVDQDFSARNLNLAQGSKSLRSEVRFGTNDAGKIEGFASPEQANLLGMIFLTAVGYSTTGQTYQLAMSIRRFWNGIGYSSRLSVDGEVMAKELKVQVSVPADYVFESDYNLMSIGELSEYVQKNHHLPNVPSSSELVKNGWEVGEMSNKLLEKVEELSLYIIQLDTENKELEKRIQHLEEQLK